MPIPNSLVEQLAKGNCMFFLGAGISVGTREERKEGKGLPSGASLTKILAEKSGYCRSKECPYYWAAQKGDHCGFAIKDSPPSWPEQYCRASLLRVSQYFELHPDHDRAALINILEDKIPDGALPLRTHKALSQIALLGKIPFVITTNYDALLEKALTTRMIKYNLIVEDKDIPQYSAEETQIVKLHGTRGGRDSYIITEADYLEVSQRLQLPQSLIGSTLRHLLSTHTILFIGYSLEDQDFRALYHDIVSTLGRHQHTAFAVQWKPTPGGVRFWEKLNVQIIDQDATQFLEELVGELAITLAQREGSQAISALEQLLQDGELDPIIGEKVAGAMARIESEAIVPILCQFLRGPITGDEGDLSIRISFIFDLEEVAPQRVMPILKQILHDDKIDPDIRITAIGVLAKIGKHEASEVLSDVLLDRASELQVRDSAAQALGQISDDKAVNTLVQALQTEQMPEREKDATIRGAIARALGTIGNEEACHALIQAIQDSQLYLDVRVTAADALGSMKAQPAKVRARSELVNAVLRPDFHPRLRKEAASTLGKIGDQSVVELESVMLDHGVEREVRTSVAAALGKIGGHKAATILGNVLQAEAQYVSLEIGRRKKHAELLKEVLQEKATDVAQEVLLQEKAVRQLSSILQEHASEIADQLFQFQFLQQSSPGAIVLNVLKEMEEKEAQLIIDRIGEDGRLDEGIRKRAIEVFDQTNSMSPIEILQNTDIDPILMISDNLRDNTRIISLEIIDDGSIADNMLARLESLDQDSYLYFMGVRDDLRAAIWQLTGSMEDELTVKAVSAKFQEKAAETARQTAQVDRVSREVVIEAAKALGNFKDGLTEDAVEGHKIAFDALSQVLRNEELDKGIRSHAAESLGRIDVDGEAVEILGELLEGPAIDIGIGTSIVTALGTTGKTGAVEVLSELLGDKGRDFNLRGRAASSLGEIGGQEAKQILSEVIQDDEELPLIKDIAREALKKLDQKAEKS